ncbi:hypothetical protein HU200_003225 [Digitaria exilis]|uniref:Glutaredoxin domain-containing protein n=1 Tax=Digitaria exilis TaxID=1010633 RepID=A0A835KUN4_9POAL|nr:hypothetical protein HU200_003225 [Digitaria exilis]
MCHTVTKLMEDLSVNALVHELDRDPRGKEMERALLKMLGGRGPAVPAVFIGGKLVGGTNRVMSLHLSGELVPMLKNAASKLIVFPSKLDLGINKTAMAERVSRLSTEKAAVIFTRSQCPMCHTVSSLFSELGVCAAVHELDRDPRGREMEKELARRLGRAPPVPAVFVGGNLIGSTDKVMALHLAGKLVPMLKAAGAIWL